MSEAQERRRGGLTENEIDSIADRITSRIQPSECKLTPEQQQAVVELIAQKKKVVKGTLWFIGALILWVLKDIYLFIVEHLKWVKP